MLPCHKHLVPRGPSPPFSPLTLSISGGHPFPELWTTSAKGSPKFISLLPSDSQVLTNSPLDRSWLSQPHLMGSNRNALSPCPALPYPLRLSSSLSSLAPPLPFPTPSICQVRVSVLFSLFLATSPHHLWHGFLHLPPDCAHPLAPPDAHSPWLPDGLVKTSIRSCLSSKEQSLKCSCEGTLNAHH